MAFFANRPFNNPIQSCRYNERLVLHLLRISQAASKANLARMTGLTAAAVGGIITSLLDKGLVENAGKLQGDMGQPATLFRLSSAGAFGFGVSINRGSIETLLIDFVGDKVAGEKHDIILPEPQGVMQLVMNDIEELMGMAGQHNATRIAGIGIAQPYHLGSWKSENNAWENWDSFDFASALTESTGLPTVVENDGNAAALAELVYGLGSKEEDFIYLFFGSALVKSLGGGVVLKGECRSGFTGNAGDIGLVPVPKSQIITSRQDEEFDGTFLTTRASLHSLVQYLRHQGANISNHLELNEAISAFPNYVDEWLDDCVSALETAVYSIQAVLDIPFIVIDGEDDDSYILGRIIHDLGARLSQANTKSRPMPNVKKGAFGSEAAAIGAATMPLDSSFSPKSPNKRIGISW